jgi:hypothetical protein
MPLHGDRILVDDIGEAGQRSLRTVLDQAVVRRGPGAGITALRCAYVLHDQRRSR